MAKGDTIRFNDGPEIPADDFERRAKMAIDKLNGRFTLDSMLEPLHLGVLNLAIDGYAKKCVAVGKQVVAIGASELQVNSLANLAVAGKLAIQNRQEDVAPALNLLTFPQRDAVRNALYWLHGEYESAIQKDQTLLSSAKELREKVDILQELVDALMPQKNLGEQ